MAHSTTAAVEPRRALGRPRVFDRDAALHAAMLVFWRNGFEAASYAELTTATGMSKPTLYATFGDKVSLFRQAVMAYAAVAAQAYANALERPTAREAVEASLRLARGLDPQTDEPAVCFLVQGALTGGADTQILRDELTALRREATRLLQDRLKRAQDEGDLLASANPVVLAEYIAALATGVSVQAAAGATPAVLNEVVALAMQHWPDR